MNQFQETRVLDQAASILQQRFHREGVFTNSETVKHYLKLQLSHYEQEVFALMLLDSQHRLIEFKSLFYGTVNSASVYPREVVKSVLKANAAAVIFAHNHPSGVAEPSAADRAITTQLQTALAIIDVSVLDHIVVGEYPVSFAQRGWL
ncbi:DNA repair protein RadC [Agarivorans sp. B2Z047]|uniref:RadC family protein n=1 Tax=Agarivorans sp. B2Z047 TaxID=2652721 RepID=UPI00128D91B7|nr:DNA repair protein RadC [Agarivorans sp. B2Z047]MPW31887.1 DNA repair protein RadC [Agarivorans sp. B2Z047]UQN43684.1 DNA repair protein RadC [Agarivorans sp. B2Z047]